MDVTPKAIEGSGLTKTHAADKGRLPQVAVVGADLGASFAMSLTSGDVPCRS
jgi:hypothetical protein